MASQWTEKELRELDSEALIKRSDMSEVLSGRDRAMNHNQLSALMVQQSALAREQALGMFGQNLGAASQLAGAQQAAAAQGCRFGENPIGVGTLKIYGDSLVNLEGKPSTAREMLQQFVNNWLKGVKLP